jgi:cell division protein FtsI (penicillin-binding protein 3)
MKKANQIYKWTLFLYCCFVVFALYCIGFAMSVIFDPEMQMAEEKMHHNIVNVKNIRRGNIISADGQPLASYYPEYTVLTDFGVRISANYTVDKSKVKTGKRVKNPVKLDTFRINIYKQFAQLLAKTVGGNTGEHFKELYNQRLKAEESTKSENETTKKGYTETVLKRINVFQRDEIIEDKFMKDRGRYVTGIYDYETGARQYTFGKNFAHSAIGVISENSVSGIENIYNDELTNGDDVLTTIDTRMQDICETVLYNKISKDNLFVGGTIILMEVATGDIKAMANSGAYYKEKHSDIQDLYNNATKATIEPGSTFKTISLMLALETGKVKLSDKFNTVYWRGKKISDENTDKKASDSMATVSRIIEMSHNVGTGNMVDKAFNRNIDKFIQAIKDLKIFEKIEKIEEIRASINRNRSKESMLKLSHGYQVKLAPIHLLMFYNAIANNGVMLKPRLVRGLFKRATNETEIFEPEIINKSICSKSTLDSVRKVLSRVVGRGSAQQIANSSYGIAGKTGTAEIWLENANSYETSDGKRELSSFCGYFPETNPKYSCIIVLYTRFMDAKERKNFYAGSTAVPLFRKVSDKIHALCFNQYFTPANAIINTPIVKSAQGKNLSIISKELDLALPANNHTWVKVDTSNKQLKISGLSLKKGIIPDVTGMGLRDAVFLLENRGLRVSYSGTGTVVKQSPEQGLAYNNGQKIHLTLEN